MTKVLFWNVENFAINKIDDPSAAKATRGHGGLRRNEASAQRRLIILSVLLDTNPDIFVMVEVTTSDTGVAGSLLSATGGAAGCRRLLALLRETNADWRLVPPLIVGRGNRAEGVAVFYRGDAGGGRRRLFTGPHLWLGGAAGPAGGAPGIPYVAPWNTALAPIGPRMIPAASAYNAGLAENTLAARILPLIVPAGLPARWAQYRQPYFCSFFETGGGAADRNISVFALHAPPSNDAGIYLAFAGAAISLVPAIAGETRIVAGDFNLNLIPPAGAGPPYVAFGVGYQPMLAMPGAYAPGGASLDSYHGYATTHIKPLRFNGQCATFMSGGGNIRSYPGLGYFGSRDGRFYSIDNILVSPAPAALAACRVTVVNNVVGTPYAPLNLAGTVPCTNAPAPGALAIPSYFGTVPLPGGFPWSAAANGVAPAMVLATNNTLRSWNNYGRIRSTSDHFAIYADV